MKCWGLVLAVCIVALGATSAQAAFVYGGVANDLTNVNGNGAGAVNGPSTTVTGTVQGTIPLQLLNITTTENLDFGSGSAFITASDNSLFGAGGVNFVANATTPFLFQTLQMNVAAAASAYLQVLVTFDDNSVQNLWLALNKNGENMFGVTITAANNELIKSVKLTTTTDQAGTNAADNINNIKQIRIGLEGTDDTPSVPEPSSLALLGIGAVGMAAIRRRRNCIA